MDYMFFKRNASIEPINPDGLNVELNKLFDKQISSFTSKSKDIAEHIKISEKDFIKACDKFDNISDKPEPDEESYMARIDLSVVESQKKAYVETLKRIMNEEFDSDSDNKYEFYSEFLEYTKHKKDKVLKTNKTFKFVFMSYAKHLKKFKDIFLIMDRDIERLEYEITRTCKEYDVYKSLHYKINDMINNIEEVKLLSEELESIKEGLSSNKNVDTLVDKSNSDLSKIRGEVESLEKKVLFKEKKINSIFLQLERPVRKYDYLVGKKGKLLNVVLNPISKVTNEKEYESLKKELISLQEAIQKNEIQIKNSKETVEYISDILNSDMLNSIKEIVELQSELSKAKFGMNIVVQIAKDNKSEMMNKNRKLNNIKELEFDITKSREKIQKLKDSLKDDFSRHYKKRIDIVGIGHI